MVLKETTKKIMNGWLRDDDNNTKGSLRSNDSYDKSN